MRTLRLIIFTIAIGSLLMAETKALPPDPEGRSYGRELPRLSGLGIEGSIDAAIEGQVLYVAGGGGLHIFDISNPRVPRRLGVLSGLGKPRQLVVRGGTAYITARENGLFIIDVRDATHPARICQYDSIELATGVALSGDICLLACRQFGVELVDIRDPSRPRYLGVARTGEAQSITARDGIGYAGVWGTREVVAFDFSDARSPKILSRTPLDGFGDGLCVRGNYLYAATGHHTRAWKYLPTGNSDDPGFGRGHGLEIFDLTDPARPQFVSRLKLPRLYGLSFDMWDVEVRGRYAYVGDTYNGFFVLDVSKPGQPEALALHRLPVRASDGLPDPVGGFAVGDGVVYLAGIFSDLHVVEAAGLTAPPDPERDHPPAIPPLHEDTDPRFTIWQNEGQVHGLAIDPSDATVYLACGMAGIEVLRLGERPERLAKHAVAGIVFDVAVCVGRVFVAEGVGGLAIYEKTENGGLKLIGRHQPGETVKQVVVPEPGKYALLHVGINLLQILDISRPEAPRVVLEDRQLGPLYGRQITPGLLEGRYVSCFWQAGGFRWYDLAPEAGPHKLPAELSGSLGYQNGMAMLEHRALITYRQGYCLVEPTTTSHVANLSFFTLKGLNLDGKPVVHQGTLYLSERGEGRITAVDIRDPEKPVLRWQMQIDGHPGPVVFWKGRVLIPGGHQGLLILTPKE